MLRLPVAFDVGLNGNTKRGGMPLLPARNGRAAGIGESLPD